MRPLPFRCALAALIPLLTACRTDAPDAGPSVTITPPSPAPAVLVAPPTAAPPRTALDLLPADAAVGLAIDSLAALRRKGDALLETAGLDESMRVSRWFDALFTRLDLADGRDESRPAAALIASLAGSDAEGFALLGAIAERVVYVLPVNPDTAGGLPEREALLAGELVRRSDKVLRLDEGHLYVGGPVLLGGGDAPAGTLDAYAGHLERARTGVSARQALGEPPAPSDLALLVNPRQLGLDLDLSPLGPDLAAAGAQLRWLLATLALDGGVGLSVTARFEAGGAATDLLRQLRAGDDAAELHGLPRRVPLFAFAARGDGTRNRALLETALDTMGLDPSLRALLAELWAGLDGSRGALYPGSGASFVAILETDDAAAVIARLRGLVEQGDDALRWRDGAETIEAEGTAGLPAAHVAIEGLPLAGLTPVRVLQHQGRVLLHAGPDTSLVGETIALLAAEGPGLAADPTVRAAVARVDRRRQVLAVANVAGLTALVEQRRMPRARALSAAALTVTDDRVVVDLWMPTIEIRAAAASAQADMSR